MTQQIYSLDFEKHLLGILILHNASIDEVSCEVLPEYFFSQQNKTIYSAVLSMYRKEGFCDLPALFKELPSVAPSVLAGLTDDVNTTANVLYYAREIKKFYLARQIQERLREASSLVSCDNSLEVAGMTDNFLLQLTGESVVREQKDMNTVLTAIIKDVDERLKDDSKYLGVETGYPKMDEMLDGLPLGELTVIGARPSMGKTAFLTGILEGIASHGNSVGFFSLEMPAETVVRRMISSRSGIKPYFIEHGYVMQSENLARKFSSAVQQLSQLPINFIDSTQIDRNYESVSAKIRVMARQGVKVFGIDHLGLVSIIDKSKKRYEAVHEIMASWAKLAQELKVAIIVLCQLKRDAEGKKPSLSDLRESGDIEQDADTIMFIHRERSTGVEVEIPTEINVEKRRNGNVGTIHFMFYPQMVSFKEMTDEQLRQQGEKNG